MDDQASSPETADWVAAQAWLVRIGLDQHLHEDELFAALNAATPPVLAESRLGHLQCCPCCQSALRTLRACAPALALPLPAGAGLRVKPPSEDSALARLLGWITQAVASRRPRLPAVGWAAAAVLVALLVARLSGDEDPGGQRAAMTTKPAPSVPSPAAHALGAADLARLRALGPQGEDYARMLASQGPQALRERLEREAPQSQVARQWLEALKP